MRSCLLLCTTILCALLLNGCFGRGPDAPVVAHANALRWDSVFEAEILRVWDGLHHSKDPKVTHLIEVEILGGDSHVGERIAFPFDEWSTGRPPPREGKTVVFSPMQWVAVDPRSMGRPSDMR